MIVLGLLLFWLPVSAEALSDGQEERQAADAELTEAVEDTVSSLDFSAWQRALDEAGSQTDVRELVKGLASGQTEFSAEKAMALIREMVLGEARGLMGSLILMGGPSLLWAVNRQLQAGGRLGESAGQVCYLVGAGSMMALFAGQMALAEQTMRRAGQLTQEIFPVLTALMSASGSAGTAGLLQPLVVLAGGGATHAAVRIMQVFAGSSAVLAAAGNLSGRMKLKSLHKLCCSAAGWLLGGLMTAFLGAASVCGIMGRTQDGLSVRAARYAVDNLLPVVGKEVAGTVDAMASGARLVRSAAGVTGMIVLLAVSLRPVIRLALGMLCFRLCAALTEPAADGPLTDCAGQMAQSMQLLLAPTAVSICICLSLIGTAIGGFAA